MQGLFIFPSSAPSRSGFTRGITNSGKFSSLRLFINQVLRLSAYSKREAKLAEKIKCLTNILNAFGNAKTLLSPNASRHRRFLELHFNDRGRIASAKVLLYALNNSRLIRLTHEERVFPRVLSASSWCRQRRTGSIQSRGPF